MQNKLDVIICLGRMLLEDGSIDWTLEGRLEKAVEVLRENPGIKLILSGGVHHTAEGVKTSEAEAMSQYLLEKYPDITDRVIIEDEGNSTIDQTCRLKVEYIMKNGWKVIGLVTDELHMPRALLTFESILGKDIEVEAFTSEVRISGLWRRLIVDREKELLELTVETRTSKIKPGDHKEWLRLEAEYQKAMKESVKSGNAPTKVTRVG